MKKIVSFVIVVCLLLAFASCDLNQVPATDDKTSPSEIKTESKETKNDPVTQPVTDPTTKPSTTPITNPITDPVTNPITDPVTEPVTDPVTEPVDPTPQVDPEWNYKTLSYLKDLLASFKMNPYEYIPAKMLPQNNITTVNEFDLSNFVNVTSMPHNGFGEQWEMITDNLAQSSMFFDTLNIVEGLTTTSVNIFQTYLDKNPEKTAHHVFQSGIYSVTIDFDGKYMTYVLDYTTNKSTKSQIALKMDVITKTKTVRIQLGYANALKYTMSGNAYEFDIKYLGVRRAEFKIAKNNGKVEGHINEILTAAGKEYKSAADFYIDSNYVVCVGNKASGIIGFTNVISELYNVKTGKLLGYEVSENLKSIEYNTLWFDLANISGITSVKYGSNNEGEEKDIYVNGNSDPFTAKLCGISAVLKAASRRFDIELRKQYFYVKDGASYKEVCVNVPMLFVQEEYFESLSKDVKDKNKNVTVAVTLDNGTVEKIKSEYAKVVPIFKQNKQDVTSETIIAKIGDPITF